MVSDSPIVVSTRKGSPCAYRSFRGVVGDLSGCWWPCSAPVARPPSQRSSRAPQQGHRPRPRMHPKITAASPGGRTSAARRGEGAWNRLQSPFVAPPTGRRAIADGQAESGRGRRPRRKYRRTNHWHASGTRHPALTQPQPLSYRNESVRPEQFLANPRRIDNALPARPQSRLTGESNPHPSVSLA